MENKFNAGSEKTANLHLDVNPTTLSSARSRARSISQALPSLRITTSPTTSSLSPISPLGEKPSAVNKAHGELRKLFAHLLARLKARPQPPSVYDGLRIDPVRKDFRKLGMVVETVKSAIRFKGPKDFSDEAVADRAAEDDSAFENEQDFSTDITYAYLTQLRDLLLLSEKQGLHILREVVISTRLHPNSPRLRQRFRSASVDEGSGPPGLLLECINIISSIISEDCRYKVSSARLSRPPYGLQAISLDIAQILTNAHRHEPNILSLIGFAVIPAFSTFDAVLHTRLLVFFENGIIRGMLEDLKTWRGLDTTEVCFSSLSPPTGAVSTQPTESQNPVVAIQVDAADEPSETPGHQGWLQWSTVSTPVVTSLSAIAPSQSLGIYQLSSLVPPLLAAMLDTIHPLEIDTDDLPRQYRFYTLLRTIITLKQDTYLDILEIVAYHGASARRKALSILATFWPKSLGHCIVGKALPIASYSDALANKMPSTPECAQLLRDHPYAHEFQPWRFSPVPKSTTLNSEFLRDSCHVCLMPINDFGLLCPCCFTCVHLSCYDVPDGIFHGQYLPPSGKDPQLYFISYSHIIPCQKDTEPLIHKKLDHKFRLANIFTLTLCAVCHRPMWGHVMQGLGCTACHKFVHSSCLLAEESVFPPCGELNTDSNPVALDRDTLEATFHEYYKKLLLSKDELSKISYEDISIYYSILWIQLRILDSGITFRSILVTQATTNFLFPRENSIHDFQLHHYVNVYEEFLSSGRLPMSAAMQDHLQFNGCLRTNVHSILFDWSLLASVTSIIKTPLPTRFNQAPNASNLLSVGEQETVQDTESHPYELATLSHMRNCLGHEFNVHADSAARYMLSHLSQVGFFHRVDRRLPIFDDPSVGDVSCSFPLPSGLDLSTSVETLVVAIEACLSDIDITVNEHGFLLLIRRFPPTGAASEYALMRLSKAILSWILSEDDRLILIARDHINQNLSLPGVRTTTDESPWPSNLSRQASKAAVNSGGEYVQCRKQLLARCALPWLAAVHELDVDVYTNCIYDYCAGIAETSDPGTIDRALSLSRQGEDADSVHIMLHSLTKLLQANVIFSSFDALITRCFDYILSSKTLQGPLMVKSLHRLFNGDTVYRRTTSMNDLSHAISEQRSKADAWKVFTDVSAQNLDGLERGLLWLRVMVYSGVDIPASVLTQLFKSAMQYKASITTVVSLLSSTMVSAWLKTTHGGSLGKDVIEINLFWVDKITFLMKSDSSTQEVLDFLRYSLVICLLAYGCDRLTMQNFALIQPDHLKQLPIRRALRSRTSAPPEVTSLEVDPQLLEALSCYVADGSEQVCSIIAKFLTILVSESAFLGPDEIDRFILTNGDMLALCAWQFYDLESSEICDIRTTFLLRILVVDPQPLDRLLRGFLKPAGKWQLRFQAVTRLFRILLDINSPSFEVQDRQWKTSVSDIINHFFCTMWLDDREEIRLAVDTWARSLLPAHLRVISSCWDEYMSKAPITDRARLVTFLVQLHPHFIHWQVLSWETIVECLLDADFVQSHGTGEDGYAVATRLSIYGYPSPPEDSVESNDPDTITLRVSLTILSLQLLADGAEVDLINILKIKHTLAKLLGFTSASLTPTANGQSFYIQLGETHGLVDLGFSSINPLMRVLDAPNQITLSASSMGATLNEVPAPGLIGDVFVDIIARLWENSPNMTSLPYAVLRGLLECMNLVIAKHDLNGPPLKHLDDVISKAIKNITDLLDATSSYDIRHLSLTVMFAYLQGYPAFALKILGHQIIVLTRLAASLHFNAEDPLVIHARNFVEVAFVQYEVTGLFWLLSKQGHMSEEFFTLLRHVVNNATQTSSQGENLRDSIIRDTLSKVAANANDRAIPDVLKNLERYVTLCHYQSYPSSLMLHIGLRLTAIARQTADFPVSGHQSNFDPNPLLVMAATIVQHNSQSIDLLLHTETLLRAALARFIVSTDTLKRLLSVCSTRYKNTISTDVSPNHIALGIVDVLSESLKGKVRPVPESLVAMLQVVLMLGTNEEFSLPVSVMQQLGVDALSYLSYPTYRETYRQAEFTACRTCAECFLHASSYNHSFLVQSVSGEAAFGSVSVRVWNLITLAGLETPSPDGAQKLLTLLPNFVAVFASSLRLPLSGVLNDSAALSVNHAFASVKLWILLARRSCSDMESSIIAAHPVESDGAERLVWNELWPPFERLLVQSLSNLSSGEKPPLLSFIWSCISDLMLFLRQARSIVSLDTSSHVSILSTLRSASHGEMAAGKFARAQRSISEPPMDIPFGTLVQQVSNDVLTAEKLQAADVYRQRGPETRREQADRVRTAGRDTRNTTLL
ncbi:hypothetical protein BU17DRAFT_44873 [Hysterangium stoloniferum]|nr:hypothetical protein BU17DRAFT_44873 [Hysterangium stoloniferum]